MTTRTLIDTDKIRTSHDLREYARRYTTLRYLSTAAKCGPCPACGGDDRLTVKADTWQCRKCHPRWGDIIEWVMLYDNKDFDAACAILEGREEPPPRAQRAPARAAPPPPDMDTWRAGALPFMRQAYRALRAPGNPGADYLLGRGLMPATWDRYRLGYTPAAEAVAEPYRVPAIVMPWMTDNRLVAIRYRFLAPVRGERLRGYKGSHPGTVFGEQGLICDDDGIAVLLLPPENPPCVVNGQHYGYDALAHRSLVIVEGEINGMSIAQECSEARVDVLSIGSEATKVEPLIPIARRYRTVLVWCDEQAIADRNARILGAHAYASKGTHGKRDANDHLQAGTLGKLVLTLLYDLTPKARRDGLFWDIWDADLVGAMV